MILTRKDLKEYIAADALACGRDTPRPRLYMDLEWKFQVALRKKEYYRNQRGIKKLLLLPLAALACYRCDSLGVKLCLNIPCNVFDKGLSIAHYGNIAVNGTCVIGKNCRIHEGVTLGSTNGSLGPRLGDNVFIGSGAKIIGEVYIADDVAIGANAVVVKSIQEKGTTWAGNPARKVSDNNSHANLNKKLFA